MLAGAQDGSLRIPKTKTTSKQKEPGGRAAARTRESLHSGVIFGSINTWIR
jgi:hypothetical protein